MKPRSTSLQYVPTSGRLAFRHFALTSTGLEIRGDPTLADWKECGIFLRRVEGAVQFWIGDWVNYGRKAYGEKYQAAIEMTGWDTTTLQNCSYVAANLTISLRSENLSFSVQKEVVPLSPKEQKKWLARAVEEQMTVAQLRMAIRLEKRRALSAADLPAGKFRVLYADPPWAYSDSGVIVSGDAYGRAERHYPTLTIEELCALPVCDLVADDAVLFLWVTSPLLAECWPVIEAWGFTYKTSIVWDKCAHNYGHYVSVRHELLLICTRGSCTPDHPVPMPDSVISLPRSDEHSEKPAEFRALIDRLYDGAAGGKCELFARRAAPGWVAFSNQQLDAVRSA